MYTKKFKYNSLYSLWETIVRSHLVFHKIDIPEQPIKCLIVFSMFGISEDTYTKIVDKKIVPNKFIIRNYKTLLKDNGLIKKIRSNQWVVCDDLKNLDLSKGLEMNIKITL